MCSIFMFQENYTKTGMVPVVIKDAKMGCIFDIFKLNV